MGWFPNRICLFNPWDFEVDFRSWSNTAFSKSEDRKDLSSVYFIPFSGVEIGFLTVYCLGLFGQDMSGTHKDPCLSDWTYRLFPILVFCILNMSSCQKPSNCDSTSIVFHLPLLYPASANLGASIVVPTSHCYTPFLTPKPFGQGCEVDPDTVWSKSCCCLRKSSRVFYNLETLTYPLSVFWKKHGFFLETSKVRELIWRAGTECIVNTLLVMHF